MSDQYIDLFADGQALHGDDLDLIARTLSGCTGPVLDVGCGPGHLTARLRSLGLDAIGVDLVPEFLTHARATHRDSLFVRGSLDRLPMNDGSMSGIAAWYSLIHLPPDRIDAALTELRRVLTPGGPLVVGFFEGPELVAFDHKVVTAYFWPVDELAERLRRVGFTEHEQLIHPADPEHGVRGHGTLAATAR